MVTRNNTQLTTCTLPVAVIKITFPSIALVRYQTPFTPVNSYLTKRSWENLIFATASGNVSVISYGVSLVTYHFWIYSSFSEFSKSHMGIIQFFLGYQENREPIEETKLI